MKTAQIGLVAFLAMACVSPTQRGQVYAVVVGIADYQATTLLSGDLRYADTDARRIARFLQSPAGGNVPQTHIALILNKEATKQNITNALLLFEKARPGDRILFYFSGHGLPGAFVLYDAQPSSAYVARQLLAHAELKRAFRASGASTRLCVADACYAGSMSQTEPKAGNGLAAKKGSRPGPESSAIVLMLATHPTRKAAESSRLRGGVFTHFLLEGLSGKADANHNNIVTIRELYTFIAPRMCQAAPLKMNRLPAHSANQAPLFYGQFSDNLPVAYL